MCRRIALADLSHKWATMAAARKSENSHDEIERAAEQEPLLDAALTGWNGRDKKVGSKPMTFIRQRNFGFAAGAQNFVPIFEQSRYKYLIYVEGHCAACRYGFMMRLGSVILKVESRCVADRMWFFPLLRPYVDHVPIRADLSDLADKIRWCRNNDSACRAIARNAKKLWETNVSKQGLLDYVQLVTTRIAARYEYPTIPWHLAADEAHDDSAVPPKLADRVPGAGCFFEPRGSLCLRCSEEEQFERLAAERSVKQASAMIEGEVHQTGRKRHAMTVDSGVGTTQKDSDLRDRMLKRRKATDAS